DRRSLPITSQVAVNRWHQVIGHPTLSDTIPIASSHPIMRRPHADLEEKREPRVASSAGARESDSMRSSGRSLTPAAIEKGPSLPHRLGPTAPPHAGYVDNRLCRPAPLPPLPEQTRKRGNARLRPHPHASKEIDIDERKGRSIASR